MCVYSKRKPNDPFFHLAPDMDLSLFPSQFLVLYLNFFYFPFFFLFFLLSSLRVVSFFLSLTLCALSFRLQRTIDESQLSFGQSRPLLASPMFRYKLHEEDTKRATRWTNDGLDRTRKPLNTRERGILFLLVIVSPLLSNAPKPKGEWKLMLSLNWPSFCDLMLHSFFFWLPIFLFSWW